MVVRGARCAAVPAGTVAGMDVVAARSVPVAVVVELAEDWLGVKALSSSSTQDLSTAARRGDLARAGRLLQMARARPVSHDRDYELARDLAGVELADLNTETIVRVLVMLRASFSAATAERTLSTLRGFTRWLTSRGHLGDDPCADDTVRLPRREGDEPFHAFGTDEVEAMRAAAGSPPKGAQRSAWPARDVAIVDVLAGAGLRAAELCALEIRDLEEAGEVTQLFVQRQAKGGRKRRVPLPRAAAASVQAYLAERAALPGSELAAQLTAASRLFVRNNGTAMNDQFLDRLVVRLADSADPPVERPDRTAAHGFRHHFGTQLALRNVPLAVISAAMGHTDPRTTARYTRSVGRDLADPLEDAGWL